MRFVPYRFLRNQAGKLRRKLSDEGELVITSSGEPFAIMIDVDEETLEETLYLVSQIRARKAVSALRSEARERGLDKLSRDEIEQEIRDVREGRFGE
ncbi:MAG: type II toxin-antitoxin system Phd/YefM family antitoxin [Anaerolineales bacterium]